MVTRVAFVWTGALGRGGCFAPLGVRCDASNNVWRAQMRGMEDTPSAGRGLQGAFRDQDKLNVGDPCLTTTVAFDAAVGSKCPQVTITALGLVICAVSPRQRGLHGRQHPSSFHTAWAKTHPTTRPRDAFVALSLSRRDLCHVSNRSSRRHRSISAAKCCERAMNSMASTPYFCKFFLPEMSPKIELYVVDGPQTG